MRGQIRFNLFGVFSIILYIGISVISREFNWGEGHVNRPIPLYLIIYSGLFILYTLAIRQLVQSPEQAPSIWAILIFGLLFRAAIFPSNQIQEDDIYRYLWDGKVFAHRINPYKYPPQLVSNYEKIKIQDPELVQNNFTQKERDELDQLYRLKWENAHSLVYMERINHPNVPTIYPPLSQIIFRVVHQVAPDNIFAMRFAFLAFDLIALAFIVLLTESLKIHPAFCLVYFWSPLIIKETFNSTHLDILGISALCGAFYFMIRKWWVIAIGFLALSVMGKYYPAILLPIFIRGMIQDSPRDLAGKARQTSLALLVFAGVILIFYSPFLVEPELAFQGLKEFTTFWERNDSLFGVLQFIFSHIPGLQQSFTQNEQTKWFAYDLPTLLTKLTVSATLGVVILYFTFLKRGHSRAGIDILRECFIIMALVFMLSPVQNPWYLSWIIPFLCVFPIRAWIMLTGLISFYYLSFYFNYQEKPELLPWLLWAEHAPFYALLITDWYRKKKRMTSS